MSKEIVVKLQYLIYTLYLKQYKSIGFFPINHAYNTTVKLCVFSISVPSVHQPCHLFAPICFTFSQGFKCL